VTNSILPEHRRLGDFTTRPRVLFIASVGVVVATASVAVGILLLKLIRLATNVAYFGQFNLADLKIEDSPLGLWTVLAPVTGALVVGLMARYGSEKIRGHGIPEAIEAILLGRSRLSLKVAILKPLSSAISIGTAALRKRCQRSSSLRRLGRKGDGLQRRQVEAERGAIDNRNPPHRRRRQDPR